MGFRKFLKLYGPRRWTFKDPDTGYHFEEKDAASLYSRIRAYRLQNELEEIDFLAAVVENYMCGLPENLGNCGVNEKFSRGILGYFKGGIALAKMVLMKQKVVQAVADERASVCLGCHKNIFPDRTTFVKWSDDVAKASIGDLKAKGADDLGECEACGCLLKAKVWYGGEISIDAAEVGKYPSFCWQLRGAKIKK